MRMAMMAITTRSSISVKPGRRVADRAAGAAGTTKEWHFMVHRLLEDRILKLLRNEVLCRF
jgi:hypothetical protein